MGIRFYCPNGHRLNVKSFLAGRRGFCPHCGASVLIPLESTAPSSKEARRRETQPQSAPAPDSQRESAQPAVHAPAIAEPPSPVPAAQAQEPLPAAALEPTAATQVDLPTMADPWAGALAGPGPQTEAALAGVATAPSGAAASPSPSTAPQPRLDAIAAAPDAVWYVRPASGGQYGPASGTVMRDWLDEGRVADDALVWREGWPQWQPAGDVFPELHAHGPVVSVAHRTAAAAAARRGPRSLRIVAAVILVAAVLVAVGVFVWILWGTSGRDETSAPAKTAESYTSLAVSA